MRFLKMAAPAAALVAAGLLSVPAQAVDTRGSTDRAHPNVSSSHPTHSVFGMGDRACRWSGGKMCGKVSNYVGSDIHVTEYGVGPRDTTKWRIAKHNQRYYGSKTINNRRPKSKYWDIDSVGIYERCHVRIWRSGWVGFRTENPTGKWKSDPGWYKRVHNQRFWKTHNHYYNWLIDRKKCH